VRFFPSYNYGGQRKNVQRIGSGGALEIKGSGDPYIKMAALTTGAVIRFYTGHTDEYVNGYIDITTGVVSGSDYGQVAWRPPQFVNEYVRPYIAMTSFDDGASYAAVGLWDTQPDPNVLETATYWREQADNTDYIIHYANINYWYEPTGVTQQMVMDSAGNVTIAGSLSKGSGSFDIEHPTLEGHRLRHSFIEGPQADLIYRGTATLDTNGSAVIDLDVVAGMTDGTWEALCRDPWSLVSTPNDTIDWSLNSKQLTIVGAPGAVCSWIVMAERHDPHIYESPLTDNDGSIVVEYIPEEVPIEHLRVHDTNNEQMG